MKYHHGADGAYRTRSGKAITVALAHNPSHLEFVGPVVDGRARAQQTQRRGQEAVHDPVVAVPVVIHGDAAFAGQGVVAETLNLGAPPGLPGRRHHAPHHQQPGRLHDRHDRTRGPPGTPAIWPRASTFRSSTSTPTTPRPVSPRCGWPACTGNEFHRDALIDLVGYRRWGHNEGDEPSYTQPLMYERIKSHATVREIYAGQLVKENVLTAEEAESRYAAAYQRLVEIQQGFKASAPQAPGTSAAPAWGSRFRSGEVVETAVPAEQLLALNTQLLAVPEGFTVNPKLKRQLERRIPAMGPEGGIDWGHAEALAFASLLTEGVPIRLTGQDTERGTFSHRHLVLHDAVNGQTVTPISRLPGALAAFEVYNSPLSELATLGLRIRLRQRRAGDAGALGGAVRRFHQRRPGHRRSVHGGGAVEVGRHQPADAAAAAWLRGPGTRALERPDRTVPAAGRGGKLPGGQLHHAGAVLPPAATPGAPQPHPTAGGVHAQEPAAAAPGRVASRAT